MSELILHQLKALALSGKTPKKPIFMGGLHSIPAFAHKRCGRYVDTVSASSLHSSAFSFTLCKPSLSPVPRILAGSRLGLHIHPNCTKKSRKARRREGISAFETRTFFSARFFDEGQQARAGCALTNIFAVIVRYWYSCL